MKRINDSVLSVVPRDSHVVSSAGSKNTYFFNYRASILNKNLYNRSLDTILQTLHTAEETSQKKKSLKNNALHPWTQKRSTGNFLHPTTPFTFHGSILISTTPSAVKEAATSWSYYLDLTSGHIGVDAAAKKRSQQAVVLNALRTTTHSCLFTLSFSGPHLKLLVLLTKRTMPSGSLK